MAGIGVVIGVLILVFLAAGIFPTGWIGAYVAPLALLAAGTSIGLGASGGVARERHRNTLIDLFMLPGGRRDILRAKLIGAGWAARWFLLAVLGLVLVAPLAGTPVVAVPLLLVAATAYLAFGGALGLWLSVRSKSGVDGSCLVDGFCRAEPDRHIFAGRRHVRARPVAQQHSHQGIPDWSRMVNPVMAWQELAMTPDDPPTGMYGMRDSTPRWLPDQPPRLLDPLKGVAVYGIAAGLLWWLALRRFEREGRED